MMLEVERLVREHAPAAVSDAPLSVACVHTSHPKYLVFDRTADRPSCVVEFGPEADVRRVQSTLRRLGPELAGHVPAPLACAPWRDGLFLQIQEGLAGAPWFELQRAYRSDAGWLRLEREALGLLARMHAATRRIPGWTRVLRPALELQRQLELAVASGIDLSAGVWHRIRGMAIAMRSLGRVDGTAQHGDFSLNNLLRSDDGTMRVLDFEEFGETFVPLHDEVGLALSMRALAGGGIRLPALDEHILRCAEPLLREAPALRPHWRALAVHHVLWRVNRSWGHARRRRMAAWLLSILDELAPAPATHTATRAAGASPRPPGRASARAERPAVLQVVLSLNPGGTERLVVDICRRLSDTFRMDVCCLDEAGTWGAELRRDGFAVTELGRRPGFHPSLAVRLARVMASGGASVLHCHHYSPFVYGRLAAVLRPSARVVFTEHGRLSDAGPSSKRRIANRLLGRLPATMFAVSGDLKAHMAAEGLPAERIDVLHNGIDPGLPVTATERSARRRMLGLAPDAFVLGTIARLDPVKDLTTLVGAFADVRQRVPGARLVIIGDGPERETLERTIRTAGLADAVVLAGQRADARSLLAAVDVFVNSSITEGVSLTILEAMAAELPVIATRAGGTPEVITDDSGVLVPARSPGDIAAAALRLHGDRALARELARGARRRVEREFSISRMLDRYAAAYAGAMEG